MSVADVAIARGRREPERVPVPEATARILAALSPLEAELVPLANAGGRTLREDVDSPIDQPPWDNSAMDGFAVRAADVRGASDARPAVLRVVGVVPAGAFPPGPLEPGTALRVMTGAPVPAGADGVIRIEHTDWWQRPDPPTPPYPVRIADDRDAGRNIRRAGEDLRRGARVLDAGRKLRPADVGLLAAIGRLEVRVGRRPRIAILSNGDELVGPDRFDEVLAGRKIVDSNAWALAAAVERAGGEPVRLGIAADDRDDLRAALGRSRGADALITTAGASVGDHDLIKDALAELGFALDFWRVGMKPGSPFSFGRLPATRGADDGAAPLPVFGLPGNPVSALVTFEVLVRPAIRRLLGRAVPIPPPLRVRLDAPFPATPSLTHYVRSRLEPDERGGWRALPTGPQGSGILSSVAAADALVVVPAAPRDLPPGSTADAIPLFDD